MADLSVTTKEISPGILLHKQQIQNPGDPDMIYIFKVEVLRLNVLEFTADFSGSENVILDGKQNLVSVTNIDPFRTDIVAKLILKRDWKLKTKFKFTLKPTSKETQAKYIQNDVAKTKSEIVACTGLLKKYPLSILPIAEVFQILTSTSNKFVDIEFPPNDDSVFGSFDRNSLDSIIHWRRPNAFMEVNPSLGLREPQVFYESIEPNDIKQGTLGDCWFMCALAALAERPALVERLFITKDVNPQGIYRVKLCKNGEWVTVTVDDYFPCQPMGGPIFSRAHGNELWVLILEKAYAKLHGNYFLLKGGFANEGFIDLTGCPSISYYFQDEEVVTMIKNGSLWEYLKHCDEEGFLISASTPGEDRWTDVGGEPDEELGGLVPGHAYSVLQVKEYKNNKLLNVRNPWGNFEWKGDWSDNSPTWTNDIKNEINPVFSADDGAFWMDWKDFLSHFRCVNICKVKNWDEVRIKGKFIRVQDLDDPNIEIVLSKWYYSIELQEKTKIIVSVHQEDVRIMGVAARRPYINVGVMIMKRTSESGVAFVAHRDLSFERQVELQIELEPGSYIILPRTTGCTLRRPADAKPELIKMLDKAGKLHELVESTIIDIFRKFDMLLNRELSYIEFKGFYECLGKTLSEKEFKTIILDRFASTSKGLSLRGFIDFFRDAISTYGEEDIWKWFDLLGYDHDLYSVRSRCFILTIHSERELAVTVRDAIQTDLDNRANVLLIQKYGQSMDVRKGIRAFYALSKEVHAYSYGVINDQSYPVEVTFDCSNSANMLFSTKTAVVKKRIEPGTLEFMMHAEALPTATDFIRSTKCMWTPISQ